MFKELRSLFSPLIELSTVLRQYNVPYTDYIAVKICFPCQADIIDSGHYTNFAQGNTLSMILGFTVHPCPSEECLICRNW